jgi:hypothetical protein
MDGLTIGKVARGAGLAMPDPRSARTQGAAMRKLINAAMFILFAVASTAALAESRTVTLSVSGMT